MTLTTEDARRILAPNGVLRAAINLGNPVLAQRQADGALSGVSVALAEAFAAALAVPTAFTAYDGAGKVVAAAPLDAWDVAFLAIDPLRAQEIAYTAPYVIIEGVFVVPQDAPLTDPAALDAPNIRIGVGKGAAYELHLQRSFSQAQLVQYPTSADVLPGLVRDGLEAGAGVRQPATAFVQAHPGYRVIDKPFMEIRQAVATPIAKQAAASWLQAQLDLCQQSGVVDRHLAAAP